MSEFFFKGAHICEFDKRFGDWRIGETDKYLKLTDIVYLLENNNLKELNHKHICWKGMDDVDYKKSKERYEICDIDFPCIVVEEGENPKNLKYRMIDGSHRMAKMKNKNINKSLFYVVSNRDFNKHLKERND